MKKMDFLILSFILIIGLLFRLYKFNIPLADLHSWRQADTAAVARNFLKSGFDLFHPQYDDLSNVQSGIENPQGYRMVEFPIYNASFALLYKYFDFFNLEQWGRLVSIFFSLITISIIYYLLCKEKNRLTAFFASFIYAVFPFFVFFSRVVLPEPTALGLTMISIFFFYFFSQNKNKKLSYLYYLLSLIFFSLALLIKPTTIFYSLVIIYLFLKTFGLKIFKNLTFYLYFLLSFFPLVFWRFYIKNYPEGIPVNEWLLTSINTPEGLKTIFFRPAFFRWIFFERINNLIFGGYLTLFFILGILSKEKNHLFRFFLFSAFFYLFVFQGGNVQHEYYQTLILPSLAIFSGLGINFLFEKKTIINQFLSTIIIIFSLFFSWYISFYQVKNFYQYPQELIKQANIIKSLTSADDKIVVDRMGDTTLLYLSERKGAPAIFKSPQELKASGYSYIITSNQSEIESLKKENYQVIFQNNNFFIFKLL